MPLILCSPFSNVATLLGLITAGTSINVGFYVTSVRYSFDFRGLTSSVGSKILTAALTEVGIPVALNSIGSKILTSEVTSVAFAGMRHSAI